MDGPRMLSGSQLVAKGATKKFDGKLPEVGVKEVSPSGSWLEQKQIQSALEARKHLIEVARIEKSGSLSHAVWRDDLQLAEVTQQTGGHWQYIGHNIGKQLYLQPEEALFLIEVNSLLLKYNDVTVSLQKAYSLCLSEISIAQYKVYASLSRLGYRVIRHKAPIVDTSLIKNDLTKNVDNSATMELNEISHDLNIKDQKINSGIVNKVDQTCNANKVDSQTQNPVMEDLKSGIAKTEMITNDETAYEDTQMCEDIANGVPIYIPKVEVFQLIGDNTEATNKNPPLPDNETDKNPLIHADNIKVEIENHAGSEVIENGINNAIEKTLQSIEIDPQNELNGTSEDILAVDLSTSNQDLVTNNVIESNGIVTEDINPVAAIDANYIPNVTSTDDNDNIVTDDRLVAINDFIERTNTVFSGVVYSVDESGVIRFYRDANAMETDAPESTPSDIANDTNHSAAGTEDPGTSTNGSNKPYETDVKYYKAKMEKLIERRSYKPQRFDFELKTLQDFNQDVVLITMPDEKYLPRNIFLHKSAYVLNKEVIRNENASNALNGGRDLTESPNQATSSRDPRAALPQVIPNPFINTNVISGNFPRHRPLLQSMWNPRPRHQNSMYFHYNFLSQPYFMQQKYRYQPYETQFANYNMPQNVRYNQADKKQETKMFHYNTILQIATRFKTCMAAGSQARALYSLLNTFNLRYGESYELTPNFDVVDRRKQNVKDVIVLEDDPEPKTKKPRLSDDNDKKVNLEKLKELAAKLKDLHMKNLAVSRHRRVFSNAIKNYNKSFKTELYLDTNFEIKDKRLIVLDSSSDSEAGVKEISKFVKSKKKLRNPFNILKRGLKNVNEGASTSRQVPILQTLSLNAINDSAASFKTQSENHIISATPYNAESADLLNFNKVWVPSDDDFGRPEILSREYAKRDALLYQAEYSVSNDNAEMKSWVDIKISILKDLQDNLYIKKQRAEALSNDYFLETESQIQPIVRPDCTDLRSALKQLSVIPTNQEVSAETSLRIHFDICNRDVHYKKTNPPKPNFRVICLDEFATFPSSNDVASLQANYKDSVPIVFAFVGTSSITYLQVKSTDLPVFIPDNDLGFLG